jgi:hypothetical protein
VGDSDFGFLECVALAVANFCCSTLSVLFNDPNGVHKPWQAMVVQYLQLLSASY